MPEMRPHLHHPNPAHRGTDLYEYETTYPQFHDLQVKGRPNWFDKAACRGLSANPTLRDRLFFPRRGGLAVDIHTAKQICDGCRVKDECLQYALDNYIMFGVWGGCSERQRKQMRRERRMNGEPTETER